MAPGEHSLAFEATTMESNKSDKNNAKLMTDTKSIFQQAKYNYNMVFLIF